MNTSVYMTFFNLVFDIILLKLCFRNKNVVGLILVIIFFILRTQC